MLTQRMTSLACVAMSSGSPEAIVNAGKVAVSDFDRALRGLVDGDEGLGLTPEDDPDIRADLAGVAEIWRELEPAVQQLLHDDAHSVVIRQVMSQNIPALKQSNAAVQKFTKTYGAGVINPDTAKTIDIAGRQRMLSQRMMKEACFIAVGLSPTENAKALAATLNLFNQSLDDLRRGNADAQVIAPPTDEIAQQLDQVRALSEPFTTALSVLESDSAHSQAQLVTLAEQSTAVLKAMHKAVLLYVSS